MALTLQPFGELVVHIDESWSFANGPISGRSCTTFHEVVWDNDAFRARSVWANGSYQIGPEVAEPNIRVMFRAGDGTLIYLDYLVRVHMPTHVLAPGTPGKTPALLSGRLEIDEAHPELAWLNRTHVVGEGTLDMTAKTQSYDMFVVRWDGDLGPVARGLIVVADFDVIVVGSGAAGLAAATNAATAGARVLVAESEQRTGGSSRLSDAILQAAGTSPRARGGDRRHAGRHVRVLPDPEPLAGRDRARTPRSATTLRASSSGSAPSASSSVRSSSPGTSPCRTGTPRWVGVRP